MNTHSPKRPTAAVLVSMDPISPKASVLFDELAEVASVKYIFASQTLDSHAPYASSRRATVLSQMLHNDFGWIRSKMDLLLSRFPPAQYQEQVRTISLSSSINSSKQHTHRRMVAMTAADLVPLTLTPVSSHRFEIDESSLVILGTVDFAVLLSFNSILTGPALHAPRHGIWSFHPADTRKYRGRPSCFFEILDGCGQFGMTLQILSEGIDAGQIICQRFVSAASCVGVDQARFLLEHQQPGMISQAVECIVRDPNPVFEFPNLERSALHRESDANSFQMVTKYLQRIVLKLVSLFLGRTLCARSMSHTEGA